MLLKRKILRKIRHKFKKIRENYKAKLNLKKLEFSKIFNHDIKTILISQTNCLELILKGSFGEITDFQKEILNQILISNKFLEEIINNAILFVKLDEKTSNLKLENIDIINQAQICANKIQPFIENKNQKIIIDTNSKRKININADKILIQKIISNLLTSSASSGFDKSNIIVSIKENKDTVAFYAKNKSVYMTKEKMNSIFEENKTNCDFNQLGINLNLNIAKKLVNAHHWDFVAESNKKENSSTFGFVVKK